MTFARLQRLPAFGAILLALGCGGDGGNGPGNQCVGIQDGTGGPSAAAVGVKDDFYDPSGVTVAANSSVTWTWMGVRPHSVTLQGAGCQTSQTVVSGTYQLTFTAPGTFNYFCKVHAMNGTVTVTN
jgi:plastocyanin